MKTRMEADSIGTLEVPSDAYYGVQSLRAKRNFPITGTPIHPVMIQNLAKIKKAAAISNREAGRLPEEKAAAIINACDEIISGKLKEEFIVDGIQGGAGTSANMNASQTVLLSFWAAQREIILLFTRMITSTWHSPRTTLSRLPES